MKKLFVVLAGAMLCLMIFASFPTRALQGTGRRLAPLPEARPRDSRDHPFSRSPRLLNNAAEKKPGGQRDCD